MQSPNTTTADRSLLDRILSNEERPISVKQVARLPELARDGRPPHRHLIYRLMKRGTRGVRLDHAVTAGGVVTSVEAVHRFLVALNDPDRRQRPADAGPTPRRQTAAARRAHSSAMAQLAAAGLQVGGSR